MDANRAEDLSRVLDPAVLAAGRDDEFRVLAVAGGSCSGKTAVAEAICGRVARAGILPMDDYYISRDVDGERFDANFDEPAAIDMDLIGRHLDVLRTGASIEKPTYDFRLHRRSGGESFGPFGVVVVDGLFALHPSIAAHVDFGIWVECPDQVRLDRRLRRDVDERGRSRASILHQYETTVRPMHEMHVEVTRPRAHLVVPNPGR